MAYYTGISGVQSFNPEQSQQPFATLGQTSYNLGTGAPNPVTPAVSGSSNPITNTAPQSQRPSDNNLSYAKSYTDVPTEVQQAAQPYLSGTAGYGDPAQSLFGRNLTSNYNNWTSQYGQTGQQFMPWALRQGSGGGGYDPSQVDLFNPIAGKNPTYNFNSGLGQLNSTNSFYNPISGTQDQAAMALQTNNPSYALSRNWQDINPNYIADQFGKWTQMGAQGLPTATDYASQYYQSQNVQPQWGNPGSGDWTGWYQNGLQQGLLQPGVNYHQGGLGSYNPRGPIAGGPGSPQNINMPKNVYGAY